MHPWHALLTKREKTNEDKALIAAVCLLSTQHDPTSEARSFSHLVMEEIFEKLVAEWEAISQLAV